MTSTGGATTPAGWYTDPGGSGHLRWWDGSAWTAHLAPQPTPAPTPVLQQPVLQQPVLQQPVLQQPVVQQPVVQQPVQQPYAQQPSAFTADNQPYVPFQGSWNTQSYGGNAVAGEFARPGEWNTGYAWFLAAWPIYFVGLTVGWAYFYTIERVQGAAGGFSELLTGVIGLVEIVILVLVIFAAFRDRARLRRWGYIRTASPGWIFFVFLVGPLVYLIVRAVRVYGEVRKGIAPLILYLVSGVAMTIIWIVVSVTLGSALLGGLSSSTEFASSLQTGLDQKGGHFTVTCPPSIPTAINSTFTCTAVDSRGTSHSLSIEVIQGTNGQPTVKLLAVTPAIAG
jgi:Protein of unknown function (DUF2510)